MYQDKISSDDFFVERHNLRIFRVERLGTATILWTSREDAMRYLQNLQERRMQVTKTAWM